MQILGSGIILILTFDLIPTTDRSRTERTKINIWSRNYWCGMMVQSFAGNEYNEMQLALLEIWSLWSNGCNLHPSGPSNLFFKPFVKFKYSKKTNNPTIPQKRAKVDILFTNPEKRLHRCTRETIRHSLLVVFDVLTLFWATFIETLNSVIVISFFGKCCFMLVSV